MKTYESYPAVLYALADPTRRSVLESLREGPRAVGEIASELPVSRPAVSQHLKVLKAAGLVVDEASGNRRLYRVDPSGLASLHSYLDRFWDRVLDDYAAAAVAATSRS